MDRRSAVLACAGLLAVAGVGYHLTRSAPPEVEAADPSRVKVVRGDAPAPMTALDQRPTETLRPTSPSPVSVSTPTAAAEIDSDDPIAAGLLPPDREDSPYRMYARLRAEARDAGWAPQAERALRQEYAALPHVDTPGNPLRSRCGATICEVSGTLPKGLQGSEVNVAMEAMQGRTLHAALERHGLQQASAMFSSDATGRGTFVIYSTRKR